MPVALRTKKIITKPANPQADPRFKSVKNKISQNAQKIKKHPTAKQKAAEAAKAAKGPPNEKAAGAKANQVDVMKAAEPEAVKTDSFLTILQAEIQKVMPKTMGDTENFMEGGEQAQMKAAVSGEAAEQKDAASADIDAATKKAPDPSGVQAKTSAAIPPDAPTPAPSVNAAAGMPAPTPDAEISQQQNKTDSEKALKENKITPDQLRKANDPRFSAVLSTKDNVARVSDSAPAKYRGKETTALSKGQAQAQGQTATGMSALANIKVLSNNAVKSRQETAKKTDEDRRLKVTKDIEKIYDDTKVTVEQNLNTLEADVVAIFDAGAASAIATFKADCQREIDEFKDKQGVLDWIKEKLKLVPPEIPRILDRNLVKFEKKLMTLAERVAGLVDRRLAKAKTDIEKGQSKIKAYVAALPKDLQKVGKSAEETVSARFDEMKQGIEDKKNDLAQKLAQRYREAYDQAKNARDQLEQENKDAFDKFAEAVGDVIKILTEFKDKLMAILRKGADTIELILKDPIGFLGNLIAALKAGVGQFVANIWTHLKAGFMKWLFGALSGAGIEIPADFSPTSLFKMVMSVLGLTVPRLRAKAVKLLGPAAVAVIEKLIEYVTILITGGPAKLWEQIKSDVGDLKVMIIDAIQSWIVSTIIKQAAIKLVSFINPAGAIVQAVMAIYNGVMFIIERAAQIMEFVEAVINSVSSIAQGAIGAAANWIEKSLGNMIPLVIGFLARLIGLGGISQKIKEFITKVQTKVDKAIDKAIGKIVQKVKKLIGKLTGKKGEKSEEEKKKQLEQGMKAAQSAIAKYSGKKAGRLILRPLLMAVKLRHRLTSLELIKSGTKWSIRGTLNPEVTEGTSVTADDSNKPEPIKATAQVGAEIGTSTSGTAAPVAAPVAPAPAASSQTQNPEGDRVRFGKRIRRELVIFWSGKKADAAKNGDTDKAKKYAGYIDNILQGGRPTPSQSEVEMQFLRSTFGGLPEAESQASFKDLKRVPHGTKGSTRPDIVESTGTSVEVKRYKIENLSNMIATIRKQVDDRRRELPYDQHSKQAVIIDFRGQKISRKQVAEVRQQVAQAVGLPLGNIDVVTY